MKKIVPYKEQAIFAYKTAARSLVALLSFLIVFLLAYLKGGPYGLPLLGIEMERNIGKLDSLLSYVPKLNADRITFRVDTLERIKAWGFPPRRNIFQEKCCAEGAFYHLFLPWEKDSTLSAADLKSRFEKGIEILFRDVGTDLKKYSIEELYLSQFVLLNSHCDSILLADHYYSSSEMNTTEFDINNRKREFGKIAFLDDSNLKQRALDVGKVWLPILLELHYAWSEYKDSISVPRDFSFANVEKLTSFLKRHGPNNSEIDSPVGKIDLAKGFRILSPLIFALLTVTTWFFIQGEEFEFLYWRKAESVEEQFHLVSLSSGLFFFFQKNGPTNRKESRHFLLRWSLAILVSLFDILILVVFPIWMSLLLPCSIAELVPSQAWKSFYYVVAFFNLVSALMLVWHIEKGKYWSLEKSVTANRSARDSNKNVRLFGRKSEEESLR